MSQVLVVLALLFAMVVASGCGDDERPAAEGSADSTAATGATTGEPATGATGASPRTGEDDPASPGGDEGGDEEPARVPVEITVVDGGFSDATTKKVHVPAFIAIELDVTVRDSADAKLRIERAGGEVTSHTFAGGSRSTYLVDGLRPGRALTVSLGGAEVDVVADLDPGP